MGQLYRYIDKKDGIIKYVGQVHGNEIEHIFARIDQEYADLDWTSESDYDIEYFSVTPALTEAETWTLETHFINKYNTGAYYNKNWQVGMGDCRFVPDEYDNLWRPLPDKESVDLNKLNPSYFYAPYTVSKMNQLKSKFISTALERDKLDKTFQYLLSNKNNGKIQGLHVLDDSARDFCLSFSCKDNNYKIFREVKSNKKYFSGVLDYNAISNIENYGSLALKEKNDFCKKILNCLKENYGDSLKEMLLSDFNFKYAYEFLVPKEVRNIINL